MERSDAELVEAACRGDVASFRDLYERHYRMAVGIARSRLSDSHMAEDAAQEAFAIACRRLAALRDARRFPQWLGTICRRTASQMARGKTNHAPLDDVFVAESQHNGAAQAAAQLHQAMERLSASSREVIVLHYFSGLTYEQISQALGITPQSVHGRLQRARWALALQFSRSEE